MIFPWRFRGVLSHGRVFKKLPNRCFKITSNNFLFWSGFLSISIIILGIVPGGLRWIFARFGWRAGSPPLALWLRASAWCPHGRVLKRRRGSTHVSVRNVSKYGKVYRKPWFHWWKSAVMGCFTLQETTVDMQKKILKQVDSWGRDLCCCYLINTE